MRRVARPILMLVLAQGLCLAVGLWLHDRFLTTSARWSQANAVSEVASPHSATEGELQAGQLIGAMPAANAIAFVWTFGLQSVIAYFLLARLHGAHQRRVLETDEQMLRHSQDLIRTQDAVIFGLAKLAESRDPDTGFHLERISLYSTQLAAALAQHPKYQGVINQSFVRVIGISSALHDIGKVALDDSILLNPAELSSNERHRMQLHTQVGTECIRAIERRLGPSNFLAMAREITHSHHERWDGRGYPDGLAGERIPLTARIVAVADVYDALRSRRVYKRAMTHEECVAAIREEAGRQFDPDIVSVFLSIERQIEEISRQFTDESLCAQPASHDKKKTFQLTLQQQELLIAKFAECQNSFEARAPAGAPA